MADVAGMLGALFFLAVWGLVFSLLRRGRGAMLRGSAAFAVLGPIFEYWHLADYWHPAYLVSITLGGLTFGLEDLLFSFAFAGICIGLLRMLLGPGGLSVIREGFGERFFLVWPGIAAFWILVYCYGVNSLYAISVGCLVSSALVLFMRPAWTVPALWTALVVSALMWVFYWGYFLVLFPGIIESWWEMDALWGVALAGVPLEEPLWALAAALFIGPVGTFYLE